MYSDERKRQFRKSQKKRRHLLKCYESVFKENGLPSVITNFEGVILAVNQAWEDLTGFGGKECVGNTCSFLQCEETSLQTKLEIKHAVQNKQSYKGSILNRKKDGTQFWNHICIVPHEFGFLGTLEEININKPSS